MKLNREHLGSRKSSSVMIKNKIMKEYMYTSGEEEGREVREKLNEIDNFEFNSQGKEKLGGVR